MGNEASVYERAEAAALGDVWPEEMRGDAWEPPKRSAPKAEHSQEGQPEPRPLNIIPCGRLLKEFPERRPAVIEGLLREGETMNIIAARFRSAEVSPMSWVSSPAHQPKASR